ncbi:COX15/CtaA family protein [Terracoccus luteus]|uniref:Cytochrome c oxidase assembly protein subunit 15 n=1 Tax=Terracoccus luteus TaxID=53356 RepID=A0A495XU88_9MICO|nr:COX15/CtaA family protein [Terracoccus luteus]MBB2987735.1 cytochrome c oxidase assembly protein subunit 15 [Terracoccus luteus]MCP2173386.1 cytochrome c oxidase assembly protein subunit 15 [Terracoccus luteus]RKT78121.1 cytochrome c oxidase assembly protein subunit 15 [Terracoccus luteus]
MSHTPTRAPAPAGPVRPAPANVLARLLQRVPAAPASWVRPIVVVNLVVEVGIVLTGGVVRLTGSGLGCTTWPECMPGSFTPTRVDATSYHDLVEFGNRTLTGLVGIVALLTIWAVVTRWPHRTRMHVLALGTLGGIVAQGVLGGITVLTGLNPWFVMGHFLLSMVLVAVATALLRGTADEQGGPGPLTVHPLARRLAQATALVGAVVLALGTVVTGSGPHSGDAEVPNRTGFDPKTISWLHADVVMLFSGLVIATLVAVVLSSQRHRVEARVGGADDGAATPTRAWFALPGRDDRARRSWYWVLVVTLLQGVVGYAQYFTGLPILLVLLHMLGASLLTVTLTRGVLDTRERPV